MNIVPSLCELCQYGQKNGRICYMPGCKNSNKFKQRGVEDLEKELDSVKQERDAAGAQVALLRGALEIVVEMGTYRKDGYASEDMLEEPWATVAANALASTPSEAAERVQALVKALESIEQDGWCNETPAKKIARGALVDWRGES